VVEARDWALVGFGGGNSMGNFYIADPATCNYTCIGNLNPWHPNKNPYNEMDPSGGWLDYPSGNMFLYGGGPCCDTDFSSFSYLQPSSWIIDYITTVGSQYGTAWTACTGNNFKKTYALFQKKNGGAWSLIFVSPKLPQNHTVLISSLPLDGFSVARYCAESADSTKLYIFAQSATMFSVDMKTWAVTKVPADPPPPSDSVFFNDGVTMVLYGEYWLGLDFTDFGNTVTIFSRHAEHGKAGIGNGLPFCKDEDCDFSGCLIVPYEIASTPPYNSTGGAVWLCTGAISYNCDSGNYGYQLRWINLETGAIGKTPVQCNIPNWRYLGFMKKTSLPPSQPAKCWT